VTGGDAEAKAALKTALTLWPANEAAKRLQEELAQIKIAPATPAPPPATPTPAAAPLPQKDTLEDPAAIARSKSTLMSRQSVIDRRTGETQIRLALEIDGTGSSKIETKIPSSITCSHFSRATA